MTYYGSRIAQEINAVSKIHKKVSRNLLNLLWKNFTPEELHIGSVTNGVHYPTWVSKDWQLFSKFVPRHDDLQAGDRDQASYRDRLTLTQTVPASRYCSNFQDTRHRGRTQSPFLRGRLFVKSLNLKRPQGAGTFFPTKRTSNGLSDLAGLHFVAGKLSQSPNYELSPFGRDRHCANQSALIGPPANGGGAIAATDHSTNGNDNPVFQ